MFLDIQKLKTFYKNSRLDKTAIKMWCQIFQKRLYLASDSFEQKRAKKYQKHEIVNILRRNQRPKLAILANQ